MDDTYLQKIPVGVSSCLMGEKVRFDAGHKKNAFILDVLSEYFSFSPFCPEVAIGLGIPREPIRLVLSDGDIRCKGVKNTSLDVTDPLRQICQKQKKHHQTLCGYIVKKGSPSCGMERVKVYNKKGATRDGVGIFTQNLLAYFPNLPVEEEGRLQDPHLRENFIQRVFVYARWRKQQEQGLSLSALQQFHAAHKYIFMSHCQVKARELGSMLAVDDGIDLSILADTYEQEMMALLKHVATRKNHVNTLQHIQGYLKNSLDEQDKMQLTQMIDEYRMGLLPLIVPVTLLRYFFKKYPNDYIYKSYYLSPYPGELMLLNHI